MIWQLLLGTGLVLLGFSYIIQTLFHISIPILGLFFGFFLFYLGFRIIVGDYKAYGCWHCCSRMTSTAGCYTTCLGSTTIHIDHKTINHAQSPLEYKTILGESTIDFERLDPVLLVHRNDPLIINIETVLAKTSVKLNKEISTRIVGTSILAKLAFPDQTVISSGQHIFHTTSSEKPMMIIYASVTLGAIEFDR